LTMSEELVKRLRTTAGNPAICKAAATTIERLTRERDEFRGKLAETCGKWQASEIRAEAELAKAQQERDEERDAAGKASWDILTLHSRIASLSTELARAALPPAKTEGE
jgi:uncharacterized coiled-coil DUF342 family protein